MSETEFLTLAWQSCINRVVAMVEEYSADWHQGPSKDAADAICIKIRNMPVPVRQPENPS